MTVWSVPGYAVLKVLGSGGFGEVVLARHDATGTLVAIKYLRQALLSDPGFAGMFRAEAAVLSSLDDPNVVRLYEYVESPSGAAIVMELVNGVTLREILARQGGTSAEAALVVLKGSLLGLAAAHRRGVVHRDYKPENVLVSGDGVSKLTDFGIAARAGERPFPAGTLHYVAPEQMAGAPASPAGDVYSATATFYECLTGRAPFTGDSGQLLRKHSSEPVPLDPVPEPLRPLVAAGMAKDPRRRPADAAGFVTGLQEVAAGAYGRDWADRGRSQLGEAALLLAALWPSAAAPAVQGTGVYRLRLLRRLLPRVSPLKAVIAAGLTIAVIAAGVVAARLSHSPPTGGHPAAVRRAPVTSTRTGLPGDLVFMTSAVITPSSTWLIHEISPKGAGGGLLPIGNELCCSDPALSPDGTKLTYTEEGDVSVTDLKGHPASGLWSRHPVISVSGYFQDPVWSPSGKQIAFIAVPGGAQGPEIDVINADGTGRRRVIQGSEIETITQAQVSLETLAWSPDGTQIAFATTPEGTPVPSGTIAAVPVSGGPAHTLVSGVPGGVTALSWAPGPQPLFTNGHEPGIWEADGHGGAKIVLQCGTCLDSDPSWAPDGVHFAAARHGKGIIVATVHAGVQTVIGPPDVTYVQWGGPAGAPSPSVPSPPPASPAVPLTDFKVCTSPALTCTGYDGPGAMQTEPTQITVSADGSAYVKNLTWSGWGSATATGTGTLELDDCNPNCAQGTFTGYLATVTLSSPAGFGNGEQAYSVMVVSAHGSSFQTRSFTTGLVP